MSRTLVEELDYWEGEYHYPAGLLRSAATRIRNLEEVLQMIRDKPTVGRMIHYVAYGTPGGEYQAAAHRAAIITEVVMDDGQVVGSEGFMTSVGLCVINPTGLFFRQMVPYDGRPTPSPGTWHWPERV